MATVRPRITKRLKRILASLEKPKQILVEKGLLFPGELPPLEERHAFPRDITKLTYVQLRKLLSFFTAYYGYAAVQSGIAKGQVLVLESFVTRRKAILFERFKPEKKTSDWSEAIQGRIYADPEVKKLETKLANARALSALLDSVVWTYLRYTEACSREISARASEREIEGKTASRYERHK